MLSSNGASHFENIILHAILFFSSFWNQWICIKFTVMLHVCTTALRGIYFLKWDKSRCDSNRICCSLATTCYIVCRCAWFYSDVLIVFGTRKFEAKRDIFKSTKIWYDCDKKRAVQNIEHYSAETFTTPKINRLECGWQTVGLVFSRLPSATASIITISPNTENKKEAT